VNTIPGMTTKSFVPKSAQAIDVSFDDLMLLILSDCMEFYNESI
jgi:D-alanine-D-alanine ligase-like ATP-grasp enzyme